MDEIIIALASTSPPSALALSMAWLFLRESRLARADAAVARRECDERLAHAEERARDERRAAEERDRAAHDEDRMMREKLYDRLGLLERRLDGIEANA